MLFIHTLDKVLSGEKTQTRRIVKPNHHALNVWRTELGDDLRIGMLGDKDRIGVVQASGRDMWRVLSDYAVQPGRGKPAVARIRITGIRCQDVRDISTADACAEGFERRTAFFETWTRMHDKAREFYFGDDGFYHYYRGREWGWQIASAMDIYDMLAARPDERYQAWALTFELVK